MTPTVLLTGFEAFGGDASNPSLEIVRRLDGERIAGHRVAGAILPVSFADAPAALEAAIDAHAPSLVVALGQAGGREGITLERVAVNLVDARIADNLGDQPIDVEVVAGGPPAYFTTLPVKAMLARVQTLGIPSSLSLTAGSYVCNQVAYALAHRLARDGGSVRGGFIHVPWSSEQAICHPGQPCLPVDAMVIAIRAAIETAIVTHVDLVVAGGATH
ncbi:pyroglutamyl-peptidase I [Dokdonella sp. MW10]|uniref:pyroglutamyl-peptidase I n=1 Tax=Dokdonella sp. MW10 TaxID=2992926 RepID=UPI003F815227